MSKKPQRSLVLTPRGRAYLALLANKLKDFPVVKTTTQIDAKIFLMRCGYSVRSLDRLKSLYSWADELDVLKQMKRMSKEELFICINNVREPMTMAENEHFSDLPLRFVKGVLESTISILPGVTAVGKGLWENGQDNVCQPHNITMVSMSGVFAAHGPFSEYCQELAKTNPKQLARLYLSILKDRFTTLLKALAAQCPEGSVLALKVLGLGAGLHAFKGKVGSFSASDFVKERLDVAIQEAILGLNSAERFKFAGICLDVYTCAHPAYGKDLRIASLPIPYRAIKGADAGDAYSIPESAEQLLASLSYPDRIAKRIAGKTLIQVAVTPTDWATKELCEGRDAPPIGSGQPAESMDHAFGISTNAMQVFNNAGQGKYSIENDNQAPYATMDTAHIMGHQKLLHEPRIVAQAMTQFVHRGRGKSRLIHLSEDAFCLDKPVDLISVNSLDDRLKPYLLSLLEHDSILPGEHRQNTRDVLNAHYPGLGGKADTSFIVIQDLLSQIKKGEAAINAGEGEGLADLKSAWEQSKKVSHEKQTVLQVERMNEQLSHDMSNPVSHDLRVAKQCEDMNKGIFGGCSKSTMADYEEAVRQAGAFEAECREAFQSAQKERKEALVTPLKESIAEVQAMWMKTSKKHIEAAAQQKQLARSCALWSNSGFDGNFDPSFDTQEVVHR